MTIFDSFGPIVAISPIPNSIFIAFCQENNIKILDIPKGEIKEHLEKHWREYRGIIFQLATGAVIRLIGDLLRDKATDPAIITIDPTGKYVIGLCGGHGGRGDRLTRLIAAGSNAEPIITTASTALGLPEIDLIGVPYGWKKGGGNWTGIAAAIVRGEPIQVIQEAGSRLWYDNLPPDSTLTDEHSDRGRVWIGFTKRKFNPDSSCPKVQWFPRVLWVGIGCVRGTPKEVIGNAIETVFRQHHLATESIAGIGTIDLKSDEVGLVEYCREFNFPLKTFTPEELGAVTVPNPSNIVLEEVGTPSVAEASALKLGEKLLVNKQILEGSVTIAVSLSEREYTGRNGEIYLVGIGPGKLDQITPAARSAIVGADAIIGYSLYVDLIRPLLSPHQIIEALPITKEKERALRAIDLAEWGLSVAVISSGDAGIYGMAGLVLEALQGKGWNGKSPKVSVFPGISAIQAVAARIGAPLMHDFCTVSLSDLLTPRDVIVKRLEAAAMGDFVTGLYNPRSNNRQDLIVTARDIFLKYRHPLTPVAIVRNVYRDDEDIVLTNLGEMLDHTIDMLTLVLIGNSNTRHYLDRLITPRGYVIDG